MAIVLAGCVDSSTMPSILQSIANQDLFVCQTSLDSQSC